jgi:hypothetical protein
VPRDGPPPATGRAAPIGREWELVERGVSQSVAADLVQSYPKARIRAQIERADWLRETKPRRVKDLGAYLAKAIREDYAAPASFEAKAARAARETADRAAHDREVEARQATARAQAERDRIQAYWEALPPERRTALDAEALASADPADRAAYEAAAATPVKKMLLTALRDALIRQRLGLPAVS